MVLGARLVVGWSADAVCVGKCSYGRSGEWALWQEVRVADEESETEGGQEVGCGVRGTAPAGDVE